MSYICHSDVGGKKILEVGSRNINGSIRTHIESLHPAEYIGVDISRGPGVDIICDVTELYSMFGSACFDLVICTEVIEHVLDWSSAIFNLKQVLRRGGLLLVTTRSKGFPYHGFPFDYWRFEPHDFNEIFSEMNIIALEKDRLDPGVLILARKSLDKEDDLPIQTARPLYSMLTHQYTQHISPLDRISGFISNFEFFGFLSAVLPETVKKSLKKIFHYGNYR